ncbi:MAG: hypothetical protein SFY92_05135, partial [Verrucomicrobiae bacterium]|nr:hypothetical protein [Verrucomicrobiae bacterium]
RDPHIVRTLEVFAKVGDFVSQVGWGQADVDRAIIALAKNTEPPMRPASVTDQVLTMDRCGITQEMREENYARMLRADPREVKRALEEHLLPALAEASICVVSSREKLEEANARLGAGPLAIENILKG